MALIIKDANDSLVSLANKSDKWAVYNTKAAAEDALTNDELAEGMIVGVVSTTDTPLNPDYSTAEINTGAKWIDGKPIYRKCYYSATNWANNTVIDTISNVSYVVNLISISSTNTNEIYQNYSDGSSRNDANFNTSNGKLSVRRAAVFVNSYPASVIIEYTKTGD